MTISIFRKRYGKLLNMFLYLLMGIIATDSIHGIIKSISIGEKYPTYILVLVVFSIQILFDILSDITKVYTQQNKFNPYYSIGYRYDDTVVNVKGLDKQDISWEEFERKGGSKELFIKWVDWGFNLEENDLLSLLATIGYIKDIWNWHILPIDNRSEIIKIKLKEEELKKVVE